MGRNNNIFGNSGGSYYRSTKKSKAGLIIALIVLILGSGVGFTIFKMIGEDKFTSRTPIIADEIPVETPVEEVVPEVAPEDLVDQSNHIHKASEYAYSTEDVRNWITGVEAYSGDKIAFLTFDDGPSPANTGKILDILKEKDATGTFFIVGTSIDNSSQSGAVLNRVLEEGNAVALHSYTHVYEKLYPGKVGDKEYIKGELDLLQDRIREVTGRENFKSEVFRYPGGHMTWDGIDEVDAYLKEDGIEYIDWNAMNGDSEPTSRRPESPEALADYVMESLVFSKVKDVVVVLLHDAENKSMSTESLPMIIDILKEEGYKFGILK